VSTDRATAQAETRPDPDQLAALVRQMGAESHLDAVWDRVVLACVSQIDGAEHAGITLLNGDSVSTPAATSELVRIVDRHQYATGEGPCLTAAVDHEPVVRVADLAVDPRWPRFSAAVAGLEVRSMLAFRLYTDTDSIGGLNVYARSPNAFSEESVHTGTLLATHAAVAVAAASQSEHLRTALASRDTIGQAKGILMERYKITADQAFDLLIAASQQTHRKLKDIASDLAATGELTVG
jgi:transcriptional regulator with GAF, ATPase, and Fis domain